MPHKTAKSQSHKSAPSKRSQKRRHSDSESSQDENDDPRAEERRSDSDREDSPASDSERKRKRVMVEIQNGLKKAIASKRSSSDKFLEPYKLLGRFIPRAINPFQSLLQAFQVAINELMWEDMDEADRKEADVVYAAMLKIVPGLSEQIQYYQEVKDVSTMENLFKYIENHGRYARTDDVGSLRCLAMSYIPFVKGQPSISITNRNKSERGFAHVASARLLCPRMLRNQFDQDPEVFCRKVQDGSIVITANDWPSFLYPEEGYDPKALDKGLLRGPFLLSCFRHVFTGARTAMKDTPGPSAGKKAVADNYQMDHIHPRNIAYIAVVARFILNGQEEWAIEDGNFNANIFFRHIVALFDGDDDDDGWSDDTKEWWNHQVLGAKSRHATHQAKQGGSVATLAAQRAARRHARIDAIPVNNPVDAIPVNNPVDAIPVNNPVDVIPVNNLVDANPANNPVDAITT